MSKNYCPDCDNHEASDIARFCAKCGKPLKDSPPPPRCLKCNGELSPADRYCPYCGVFRIDKEINDMERK
jgi:predicted amidophosphoribosyltransferase